MLLDLKKEIENKDTRHSHFNLMHLLVIDNYDSFTYNIVQYFGELGANSEVIRNDSILANEINVDSFDGIIISPGPCDPDRAGISLDVIDKFAGIKPIFGSLSWASMHRTIIWW